MAIPQSSWSKFFLSHEGRVTRSQYWLYTIALVVPVVVFATIVDRVFGYPSEEGPGWFLVLVILWPSLMIQIKRWHDRDKSGWWVLIGLIPVVGAIWQLVENGFLRGTQGDNRFGADPLAGAT